MNARRLAPTAACLLATVAVSACVTGSPPAGDAARAPEAVATRPGAKATCPQAVVTRPPEGMLVVDRELVPFSSTELGISAVIAETSSAVVESAAARRIEIVSGGYVDDLTESYDDLRPRGETRVAARRATLMSGSLLDARVEVALWREPVVDPPCDVHAIVATNLTRAQFTDVLRSVRVEPVSPVWPPPPGIR